MFAIVDIESSGGNYQKDRIIEIAIIVHDGNSIIEQYVSLVNPQTPITPFVVGLTGITDEMVKDAPTFEEIYETVERLTSENIFVAHNARFDYGFIKSEFKRINKTFLRKQICTVNLSRKIIPNHRSFSLGNLCSDLGIQISNRHRALGDTLATVKLLEHLIKEDKYKTIEKVSSDEFLLTLLPKNLPKIIVDGLPEEIGVFYFHDENAEVLFSRKTKNIREEVLSFFENKGRKTEIEQLKEEIKDISYEITGNELVAGIMEITELQKLKPKYNKSQGFAKYKYGVFKEELDEETHLLVKLLNNFEKPIVKFVSKKRAEKGIEALFEKFSKFKKINFGQLEENNEFIINKIISFFDYHKKSFIIIEEGRSGNEKSAILIEEGQFMGFGYFYPDIIANDIEAIKNCIKKEKETQEIKRLIISHCDKKRKQLNVIAF